MNSAEVVVGKCQRARRSVVLHFLLNEFVSRVVRWLPMRIVRFARSKAQAEDGFVHVEPNRAERFGGPDAERPLMLTGKHLGKMLTGKYSLFNPNSGGES